MRTSQNGIAVLKYFENCSLTAYLDPATGGAPWTIGCGQTGPEVSCGVVWTQAQADAKAAIAWRDAVWQACFTQWNAAKSAASPDIPTAAALIAELPQPATHGWAVHAPRF